MSKKISYFASILLVFVFLTTPTQAQIYTLESMQNTQAQSSSKTKTRLLHEMDKPEIQAEIRKMGIEIEEAKNRIAALSDQEIESALAGDNQAGGEVVVISLTTLLLVVIVLLLID